MSEIVAHAHAPSERCGRDRDARDRVAAIVLAVAVRALAVLPRLAPMDRREPDEERARRKAIGELAPRSARDLRAHLERVLARSVVREHRHGAQSVDRPAEEVALRRMQVAARRVDAQRPHRAPRLLPRGHCERILEEARDRSAVHRRRSDRALAEDVRVFRTFLDRDVIERHERSAAITAERIGLRVPVEIERTVRPTVEVMTRRSVVRADRLQSPVPVVIRRGLRRVRFSTLVRRSLEEAEQVGHAPRL